MDRAHDLRGSRVDEPLPLTDDELEVSMHERAFALLLGAIVKNDLAGDVELAWRVALMVEADYLERLRPPTSRYDAR